MFSSSNTGWFRRRRTTSTANVVSIYDPILFGIDEDGRRVDGLPVILCAIDELAYFSVTIGTKDQQEEFKTLVRDLVARGRAAGIIVVAATQRPSADIIPTSLRDLFGFRMAFRCTTDSSSDNILAQGWAAQGYSARSIDPEASGQAWLLAEGVLPRRMRCAYLSDELAARIAEHAARLRTRAALN